MVFLDASHCAECRESFGQLSNLAGSSCAATEDDLRDRRHEYHVQDESDKDRQERDQVRDPVRNAVVALECLVDKADEELRPDEDECRSDSANHREAREHFDEVQELRSRASEE